MVTLNNYICYMLSKIYILVVICSCSTLYAQLIDPNYKQFYVSDNKISISISDSGYYGIESVENFFSYQKMNDMLLKGKYDLTFPFLWCIILDSSGVANMSTTDSNIKNGIRILKFSSDYVTVYENIDGKKRVIKIPSIWDSDIEFGKLFIIEDKSSKKDLKTRCAFR